MLKNKYLISILGFFICGIAFSAPSLAKDPSSGAILYFSPSSGRFSPGEEFWVDVMVNSGTEYVNAAATYFTYPADKVRVTDISREGSVMTLFTEQDPGSGMAKISGGKPTPGFSGINKIASVGFRASEGGDISFVFTPNSAVLTDRGNRNIIDYSNLEEGKYFIGEDKGLVPTFVESIEDSITSIFVLPLILITFTLVILALFGGLALILRAKLDKMQKKLRA